VLAHELTHLARQHDPQFVPPLARHTRANSEEELAREVEARTIDLAEQHQAAAEADGTFWQRPTAEADGTFWQPPSFVNSDQPLDASASPDTSAEVGDPWAGLPAPWQPLPSWLVGPAPSSAAAPVLAPAAGPTTPAMPQLAEIGRELPEIVAAETPAVDEPDETVPEADLDALARQVYAVLKQRLAAERRRREH
jgi:hypothetical protein